ncbi:MAG: MBL fold protein [Candidatus Parabeggiatoa sp. nov. 3]|nr:MAG: MBL fold protein [Gammaproteobacteria bacterium]RKZ66769.1 MAG: MBL fold protein [Gammaproteobacteria bacterium]RKZ80549.1 MAG: MBL fold protein [Gammaproteobacteria bacterium]HEW97639.1 MBL fold metallo-hydrolase [Beggiatoa sp.]
MPNLYILDVGKGNSAVLLDTKGVIVIDAGSQANLLTFLLAHNINTVDVLLLSHADQDHIGGAINLLSSKEVLVKSVYLNSDGKQKSKTWKRLLRILWDGFKRNRLYFEPSLTPHLNGKLDQGEVTIEILAPNQYLAALSPGNKDSQNRTLTTNSISAVIRLSHNGKHVALLPGDIDEIGLDNLLEETDNIQAKLMVFPHHGGKPGTGNVKAFTNRLCQSVKPETVIFSIGENAKHFPTQLVVETVVESLEHVRLFSTRSSEVLKAHIKKTGKTLHQDAVGTVLIDLTQEPLKVDFVNDG